MKEYNYKEIKKITTEAIVFNDDNSIWFEECKKEWSRVHNLKDNETSCVAERDLFFKPPFFLFYSKERVKIVFYETNLFRKRKIRKKFIRLQCALNRIGLTTYDIS